MNCQDARDEVERLHKNPTHDVIWGNDIQLAMQHMICCNACKKWFSQSVCSSFKNFKASDPQAEILHCIEHDWLKIDACDALRIDENKKEISEESIIIIHDSENIYRSPESLEGPAKHFRVILLYEDGSTKEIFRGRGFSEEKWKARMLGRKSYLDKTQK